jgi:hypothetical protein
LILDSGALIALERGDQRAYRHLVEASIRGVLVVAPALVVLEAMNGTRSPERLDQILKRLDYELPLTAPMVRDIPSLRRKSGVGSDADASVVLESLVAPGSFILTSDLDDIFRLLDAAGAKGRVRVLRV